MNPKAVSIVQSRLRVASEALARMESSHDYADFSDQWFVFLTAWKSVYTSLEQGAKTSPDSRQWFEAKKEERLKDPLLQYLYQARNDEEHGLANSVEPALGGQLIEIPDVGTERQIKFSFNPATGQMTATRPDGGPIQVLQSHGPGPVLVNVKARNGKTLGPPIKHLGKDIDITPVGAARAALEYLASLVSEAAALKPAS